jgi:HlyD family secretion protein
MKRGGPDPTVTTQPLSRGDIVDQVGATGTLQAVTTVQVGTQVSGTVAWLGADFNSIVKKGQVIARLDPALMQTQLDTAKANLARAEADLERLRVALQDTKQKLDQATALSGKQLISATDLQNAQVAYKSADAQLKSQQAQVQQARTSVANAQVNIDHTVIAAPIDGIVISRNVDVGQTVAASMQAPTLFIIAADLTKMQVNANIDESDVGRMRPGQTVRFRVDAYPTDTFLGSVQQVRLNPQTVQNVVTYSTIIDVPNPDLRLKPGMTANLNIEVARRTNVLRVSNAALRYRPSRDTFTALNQPVTPDIERALGGGRGGFGRGRGGDFARGSGAAEMGVPSGATAQAQQQTAQAGQHQPDTQARPQGDPASRQTRNPSTGSGQASAPQQGQGSPAFQRGGGDASTGSAQAARGGGGGRGGWANMTPEERQKRMEERMAQMSPEEREAFQARMRERMAQGGGNGFGGGFGGGRGGGQGVGQAQGQPGQPQRQQPRATATSARAADSAQTIDSLFGPLPVTEGRGRVWLYMNKQLKPVSIRTGISDGTWTEVLDQNDLQPGMEVVTNVITGLESSQRPGQQNPTGNPLMGPQRGGPGGFRGGR